MSQRGPVPKRSDERIRRNIDPYLEKITEIGPVSVPRLGIEDPHPLVRDFYKSLKESAQSRFFEPSDWSYARLTMLAMNDMLKQSRVSAMMLATISQMLTSLLVTEADRRRVHLEVERDQNAGKVLDAADMFRQQLQKK